MAQGCIIAMGGGGFSSHPHDSLLEQYLLSAAESDRPRVCFLPTASGDSDYYIVKFYAAFGRLRSLPTHLSLFRRQHDDLRSLLLEQDVIYVGGGNTANMLAAWRVHGLPDILQEASAQGVVLCGLSAGSVCWYEAGVTDSFGPQLSPISNCLGFLSGSHCPHYDSEPGRRPAFQDLVARGELPDGIAADDGVALKYVDGQLVEVVSSRAASRAWRVTRDNEKIREEEVVPRYLGSAPSPGPSR